MTRPPESIANLDPLGDLEAIGSSGRFYRYGAEALECSGPAGCGSLVTNLERHEAWHDSHAATAAATVHHARALSLAEEAVGFLERLADAAELGTMRLERLVGAIYDTRPGS